MHLKIDGNFGILHISCRPIVETIKNSLIHKHISQCLCCYESFEGLMQYGVDIYYHFAQLCAWDIQAICLNILEKLANLIVDLFWIYKCGLLKDIVLQFSLAGVVVADFLQRNKNTSILRSSKGFKYSREIQNYCAQLLTGISISREFKQMIYFISKLHVHVMYVKTFEYVKNTNFFHYDI